MNEASPDFKPDEYNKFYSSVKKSFGDREKISSLMEKLNQVLGTISVPLNEHPSKLYQEFRSLLPGE